MNIQLALGLAGTQDVELETEMTKHCNKCGEVKPLAQFFRRDRYRKRVRPVCKTCFMIESKKRKQTPRQRAVRHAHYVRNIERIRKQKRLHYEGHKERYKHYRSARLARLAGAEGHFSETDWRQLLGQYPRCPYCNHEFDADVHRVVREHVVPLSRGGRHDLSNILPVCRACNSSKGDRLLGEWLPLGMESDFLVRSEVRLAGERAVRGKGGKHER